MAYDRYDTRSDDRQGRSRWREDEQGWDRDRGDRGWFERAGDEIASWFGDDEAERRRNRDDPDRFGGRFRNQEDVERFYRDRSRAQRSRGRDEDGRSEWFGGGQSRGQNREAERDHGDRGNRGSGETGGFGAAPFRSDDDHDRFERRPRWRDEGYRRPYTGRFTGRQESGGERSDQSYRPMTGNYGRSASEGGGMHDRPYGEWRARQIEKLDRDYDDYARENQSRFEDDFSSWRERRQQKRGLLGQVREQMEVVGNDGEHVGTIDRCAGDRIILAKSDEDSGGAHHSLMCTAIDRVEGDKVMLDMNAEEAKKRWRDESRDRALFEREDQGEAGPHMLGRSFSGTY